MIRRDPRHRGHVRLNWQDADGEHLEVPGREPDPADDVAGRDLARVALAAIAELPDVQRVAVAVRFGLAVGDADAARASAGLKRLQSVIRTQGV